MCLFTIPLLCEAFETVRWPLSLYTTRSVCDVKKQTFWFYVAALYKLSMIPFLLSPFYLIYMLFTMDLVNCPSLRLSLIRSLLSSHAHDRDRTQGNVIESIGSVLRSLLPADCGGGVQARYDCIAHR